MDMFGKSYSVLQREVVLSWMLKCTSIIEEGPQSVFRVSIIRGSIYSIVNNKNIMSTNSDSISSHRMLSYEGYILDRPQSRETSPEL